MLMVCFYSTTREIKILKNRKVLEISNAERSHLYFSHIINPQELFVYYVARSEQWPDFKNLPSIFGYGVCQSTFYSICSWTIWQNQNTWICWLYSTRKKIPHSFHVCIPVILNNCFGVKCLVCKGSEWLFCYFLL